MEEPSEEMRERMKKFLLLLNDALNEMCEGEDLPAAITMVFGAFAVSFSKVCQKQSIPLEAFKQILDAFKKECINYYRLPK